MKKNQTFGLISFVYLISKIVKARSVKCFRINKSITNFKDLLKWLENIFRTKLNKLL